MFLTVIATIIFLSLLIIIHEFGHFITSKFFGLKVEEFGIGFPPRVFSKKKGDTVYSVNALPFGGFVKILGENRVENAGLTEEEKKKSFSTQTAWRKTSIIIAGIIMNFIAGWFIISWLFFVGIPSNGVLISAISPDTPAATAGFTIGDLVTKINSAGKIVSPKNADEFAVFINEFRGEQLSFSVNRIGKIIELNAVPRKNPPPGEGPLGVNVATTGIDNRPFIASVYHGLIAAGETSYYILISFFALLRSVFTNQAALENVVGPIGIFDIAINTGKIGFLPFLQLIGLISLNLAVINALPFPALDGGRLFFILIEKIKGSSLPPRFEQIANGIGLALLLTLIAIITFRDLTRIF